MSKEFVDAVVSGNNIEAEKVFNIAMTTKVGDALQVQRKELANTFVKSIKHIDQEADVNETD